jgi:peptidoglycan/xylan/chitin deacetylase (PgdA/CDA1 family)
MRLTFDDGPGPATPVLLDVLRQHGVRATFFVLGCNLARAKETAMRAAAEGHLLGNHTYSHARVIDRVAFLDEIARTDALIREIVGPDVEIPVRLPYGPQPDDPRVAWLIELGRPHVHWTADFADWLDPDPAELAARMRAHVAANPDAVIDLHDSSRSFADRRNTVEAVRLLLTA